MIDLKRLRAREPAYVTVLVHEYGPLVLSVARSFGRDLDQAEDLYQEIWTQAYRKCPTYDGRGSFEAWLHRLATNVCRSEYRRYRTSSDATERFVGQGGAHDWGWRPTDPLTQLEREHLRSRLHQALGHLSEREHQAVLLRLLEGKTPDEVAQIMRVKKATVRSLTRHATSRLRHILEEPGDDLPRRQSNH